MIVARSVTITPRRWRRLVDAVEAHGLTVFARIDHAAGARDAGLELGDEQVLVFGSPKAGTRADAG